jgi:hypothetical protein
MVVESWNGFSTIPDFSLLPKAAAIFLDRQNVNYYTSNILHNPE